MANRRQPIKSVEVPFVPTPELQEAIASAILCAGCGRELNVAHITNEKGSYHGVECYLKAN